ncbi:MAG: hypothetical protein Q6M04_03505 [Thermostichus sp. BF3_bins_97]
MVQAISIDTVTLYSLEQTFGLEFAEDPSFFGEWQEELPPLTALEQERLQRVQAAYHNLERLSCSRYWIQNPEDELYQALQILKRLGAEVIASAAS